MRKILNKIANIVKSCIVKTVDDSGDVRTGVINVLGSNKKAVMFSQYGLFGSTPPGGMGVVFSVQGQESKLIVLSDDPKSRPKKNLNPGEVGVANYISGSYVFFNSSGDIQVVSSGNLTASVAGTSDITSSGAMTLKAPAVTIETDSFSVNSAGGGTSTSSIKGNVNITGGDMSVDGVSSKLHLHGEVQSGGSNTSPPV
jgi:phage gp45-like